MKIRYHNCKKYKSYNNGYDYSKIFHYSEMWDGKVIVVGIKHHFITIDMRIMFLKFNTFFECYKNHS